MYLPTHGGPLELLAAVQAVTELDEADIVLRDLIDEVARSAKLAEGKLVVVFVVQNAAEATYVRRLCSSSPQEALPAMMTHFINDEMKGCKF